MTAITATTNGQAGNVDVVVSRRLEAMLRVDDLRAGDWRMELPGGAWVQWRDPEKVTESQRRAFKEAGMLVEILSQRIGAAVTASAHGDMGQLAMVDVLAQRQAAAVVRTDWVAIALFVTSWSYDFAVPTQASLDSLGQLDGVVFDRLNRAAEDLMAAAFFDTTPAPRDDADAPFGGSSD